MTPAEALSLERFDMVVHHGSFMRVLKVHADGMQVDLYARRGNCTVTTATVTLAYRRDAVPPDVHLGPVRQEEIERLHLTLCPRQPTTQRHRCRRAYE
jgi:hypothetical protein